MPTLTLAIPKELKSKMDSLPELNWSEIARSAISKKVEEYELFKSIVAKSKLSKLDAEMLGREVNKSLHEKYKELYPKLK